MDQENRVDLSNINKTKKQFKLPKVSSFFKKRSAGPGRDAEGKFTSGSGGLIDSKRFNVKRAVPVVAVVAIAGGYFVYRSFAGTATVPPRAYQYSVGDCQKRVSGKVDSSLAVCQGKSAEALVYRYYKTLFNRPPDSGGYKYWTQKLAGDRMQPTDVATTMIEGNATLKTKSNDLFVTDLYKNGLLRNPDTAGKKYWVDSLGTKKATKASAAVQFVAGSEGIKQQAAGFESFISQGAPKVKVVQTARTKVETDTRYAKEQINAKTYHIVKGMQSRSKLNNDLKVAAGKVSDKQPSQITPADLNVIRTNYSAVIAGRLVNFKGKDWQGAVKDNYNKVKERYDKAAAINKYSPDITFVGLTMELKTAKAHKDEAQRQVDNAQWLLNETNRALTIAQGKYDSHQAWLAAEAARKEAQNNQQSGGGGGAEPTGSCNGVWPKPRSTDAQVRGCQKVLNVAQDGNWGCGTEAAFRAKYPNSTHRKTCPNLGDGSGNNGSVSDVTKTHGPLPYRLCSNIHQQSGDNGTVKCVDERQGAILHNSGSGYQYLYTKVEVCEKRVNTLFSCSWKTWNGSSF